MKGYTFTGPANKEKNVKANIKHISRVFNQTILLGDSGTARLRKGSQTGEILEEFDVNGGKVLANGRELVLYPQKPLPYETEIFLTLDDGFVIAKASGEKCNFLNEKSDITFSFITESAIGNSLEGGIVVSKIGGRYLVASPQKAEMSLFYEEKEKAVQYTKKVTGTNGWFIPSSSLLINKSLNLKKLLFKDGDNNIFLSSDGYEIDINTMILKSINKNKANKVRTFKFVEI